MTDAEFRAAGLDRLSPEELERLNQWLRSRLGSVPTTAVPRDSEGFKASDGLFSNDSMDRSTVVSRTEGSFSGWSQNTVVRLQNGQWWEVTEPSSFVVPKVDSPEITIAPAMLGSWLMKVEGYNRSVRVTRVR